MLKSPDGDEATVVPFKPNRAQRRLIARLWHRNIILKARQLGFTTLVCIIWLDHALFNADQRCGIVAQDREAAEVIFRDKVKLAYDRLPPELKAEMPLARDSANELLFAHHNSRSEARRVGKECVSTCKSRWSRYHSKKKYKHKKREKRSK